MIVDLQVNLETEEGVVDPEALVQGAKASGLDGVVLLKDGDLRPDIAAYATAGAEQELRVFSGARLVTNHGLILCIFPAGDVDLSDGWADKEDDVFDATSVIDAVEERGGVTVALRPYDRDVAMPMGDHLFSLQGLTACEVQSHGLTDIANDLALEAASNMEMPCVGSSDAKGTEGLGTVATLFRQSVGDETELCEALRNGDCWPVSFSDRAPAPPKREERSGGGRGRGGRGGRGRGGDRDGGGGRDRDRGGRGGRGGRGRGGGGGGDRDGGGGGNRRGRRGGRGGGGRGRRNVPDGYGNTVTTPPRNVDIDENAGNIIRPDESREIAEDIGNRLAPGEQSPYRRRNDDDYGNE